MRALIFVAFLPLGGCSFLGHEAHASEHHILGQPVELTDHSASRQEKPIVTDHPEIVFPAKKSLVLVSFEKLKFFGLRFWWHEYSDAKAFGMMTSEEILYTFVIWLILYITVASYYQTHVRYFAPDAKPEKRERLESSHFNEFQEFRTGLFECGKHTDLTFWSFCCPGIRWADTMSKIGIMRFWPAFCFLTFLYCLSFISALETLLCYIVIAGYMTHYRQEFKAKFNFDDQSTSSCVSDCFTYLCCMCCAVAQEARHSREAVRVGHPVIVRDDDEAS